MLDINLTVGGRLAKKKLTDTEAADGTSRINSLEVITVEGHGRGTQDTTRAGHKRRAERERRRDT